MKKLPLWITGAVLMIAGCDMLADLGGGDARVAGVEIVSVSGSDTAAVASELEVVVRLYASDGSGVAEEEVTWEVRRGGGSLSVSRVVTDAGGEATVTWTLGTSPSRQVAAAAWGPFELAVEVQAVPGPLAALDVMPDTLEFAALDDSASLSASGADAYGNAVDLSDLVWSTGSDVVAEVNTAGRVLAVGNGTTEVTASSQSVTEAATVIVAQVVTGLAVTPSVDTLVVDEGTLTLAFEARDANGHLVAGSGVAWESLHPDVATVDTAGVVTPVSAGSAEITAATGSAVDTAVVFVRSNLTVVQLSQTALQFNALADTAVLSVELLDGDGEPVEDVTAAWTSTDTLVATVTQAGEVISTGVGSASIIATGDDGAGTVLADTAGVDVTQVLASFALVEDTLQLDALADTVPAAVDAADSNGVAFQVLPAIAWSSTADGVASVNTAGQVVSVANGTARINATTSGFADSIEVVVEQVLASIALSADTVEFSALSDTVVVSGLAADANGFLMPSADTATWTSSDPTVATVDSGGTAVSGDNGTTFLVGAVGAVADSVVAVVEQLATAMAIAPTVDSVAAFQDTAAFTAGATDANGFAIPDSLVAWTIIDSGIATSEGSGRFVAADNGTTEAVAAQGAVADTASLTVWQAIADLVVDPAADTLFVGDSVGILTSATDPNGFAVTRALGATYLYPAPAVVASLASQIGVLGVGVGRDTIRAVGDADTAVAVFDVLPRPEAALATGYWMGCVLDIGGAAYCWGDNTKGMLGNGNTDFQSTPQAVTGGHVFKKIAAGRNHTCGLRNDGAVYCWGDNSYGQVGNGFIDIADHPDPEAVTGGLSFLDLDVRGDYTCAIEALPAPPAVSNPVEPGDTYCWGRNDSTQLGNGGGTDTGTPTVVNTGQVFTELALGDRHACGLTAGGAVYCWGVNGRGEFGNGAAGAGSSTPVTAASGEQFATLGAGPRRTCGVKADGGLYCWGYNGNAELGEGSFNDRYAPHPVDGGGSFSTVTAANGTGCALATDGTAWCWGAAVNGETGNGEWRGYELSPVAVATAAGFNALDAEGDNVCGLTTAGTVLCWGYSTGVGQFPYATEPRAVGVSAVDVATPLSSGPFSCAALTNGEAWCWGQNGGSIFGPDADRFYLTPARIGSLTGLTTVTAGWIHACGLTGTDLWCWGYDAEGQAGLGGTGDGDPAQVMAGTDWDGFDTGLEHTCGLESDGTVWCFGDNDYYQSGTSAADPLLTPTTRLTGAEAVTAGGDHTCALMPDGTAACWGYNAFGQLGAASVNDCDGVDCSIDTVHVSGFTFTDLSAGNYHTCGITDSGDAYCWGQGAGGALGNGSFADADTPQLVNGGRTWSEIHAGTANTCALEAGTNDAYCWGSNYAYMLGDGTTTTRTSPVLVAGGHDWLDISISSGHACGVTSANAVYCWGFHDVGRTGLGLSAYILTPVEVVGGLALPAPGGGFAAAGAPPVRTAPGPRSGNDPRPKSAREPESIPRR